MVKPKKQSVQAKSIPKKCADKTIAPQPSTGASDHSPTGKSPFTGSIPGCGGCGKVIGEDTQALQFDRCMSPESWKCAECLNLTDELYECLVSDANLSIRWFCESCDKSVMGNQTDRVQHLISVVEKLVDR